MRKTKTGVYISLTEAKRILFWLKSSADKRWKGGSYSKDIERLYNQLNEFCGYPYHPKKWIWESVK